eukprot:3918669-Amphidinium_carterae.1
MSALGGISHSLQLALSSTRMSAITAALIHPCWHCRVHGCLHIVVWSLTPAGILKYTDVCNTHSSWHCQVHGCLHIVVWSITPAGIVKYTDVCTPLALSSTRMSALCWHCQVHGCLHSLVL